mgnify:FL=1|jgi:hypothetical protein
MHSVDSLYRYYKKFGPHHFTNFIAEHPEYRSMAKEVYKMEKAQSSVAA